MRNFDCRFYSRQAQPHNFHREAQDFRTKFERKKRSASVTVTEYSRLMHKTIEPTILYFGTPVALISTLNPDGSPNLAPMSSAWWLGWSAMLGLGAMSQTSDNLIRTRECVINLPSDDLVSKVDRLALTTGKNPVPEKKSSWGYRYEPLKFETAGFASTASVAVRPPRIRGWPGSRGAIVAQADPFGQEGKAKSFAAQLAKLHVDESLLDETGPKPHIDPVQWRPLIMSFCRFFGLGGEVHPSRLAESDFMKFVPNGTQPPAPQTVESRS